jgi:hypothetical protein
MSLKPTAKRVKQEDGKTNHYHITWKGTTYICTPNGKRWMCDGVEYKTIDEFKEFLIGAVATTDTQSGSPTLFPAPAAQPTWDCLSPCCHLVLLLQRHKEIQLYPQLVSTLDAYGYLTTDKQPDFDKALRKFSASFI